MTSRWASVAGAQLCSVQYRQPGDHGVSGAVGPAILIGRPSQSVPPRALTADRAGDLQH